MGAGASAEASKTLAEASAEDVLKTFVDLPQDAKDKLAAALAGGAAKDKGDVGHGRLHLSCRGLSGEVLPLDLPLNAKLSDAKELLQEMHGMEPALLKILKGKQVLQDDELLVEAGVRDGDTLTVLVQQDIRPTLMVVHHIRDSTADDAIQLALQAPVEWEVASIKVTADQFSDQGWGNTKGNLLLELYDENQKRVELVSIFQVARTDGCTFVPNVPREFGPEDQIVSLAKPGFIYRMVYTVGGGGGHSISVSNWKCEVFPEGVTINEPKVVSVDGVGCDGSSEGSQDFTNDDYGRFF